MPFINAKVTTEISKEKELALKAEMGKAISLIGKSEAYLMVGFEDNCRLWFKGSDEDCAYIEVALLGSVSKANAEKLTQALCVAFEKELGISGDRIYVKYSETDLWGYDGFMF